MPVVFNEELKEIIKTGHIEAIEKALECKLQKNLMKRIDWIEEWNAREDAVDIEVQNPRCMYKAPPGYAATRCWLNGASMSTRIYRDLDLSESFDGPIIYFPVIDAGFFRLAGYPATQTEIIKARKLKLKGNQEELENWLGMFIAQKMAAMP